MSDLDARYGRRRPLPHALRRTLVVLGILLLMGGVVAVFLLWRSGQPEAQSRLLAYDVVSDRQVDAEVEVRKPAGERAVCDVVAQNESTEIVGRTSFDVTSGDARVVLSVVVETTERAVLARVDGCRLG